MPACALLVSPWLDLSLQQSPSVAENAARDVALPVDAFPALHRIAASNDANVTAGGRQLRGPAVSALQGDWGGLCPLFFHCAEAEALRDDSVLGAGRARKAGVARVELRVEPFAIHELPCWCNVVPEAEAAVKDMGRFCRDSLLFAEQDRGGTLRL